MLYIPCFLLFPQGGNQGLTVVIQGQGQTTGQLQLIPQGMTVLPGPGQQLMQAAMPNGTVQRFLFTPLSTSASATSSSSSSTTNATAAGRRAEAMLAAGFADRTGWARCSASSWHSSGAVSLYAYALFLDSLPNQTKQK